MPAETTSNGHVERSLPSSGRGLFHLPPRAQAARMGRQSVRRILAGTPKESLERVELLVSELVTNSVTHGALAAEQSVDLRVTYRPGLVRVEVVDPGAHFDPGQTPSPGGESRWGLYLLNAMADRWGIERLEHGKSVWFEIDL
jgi:anti-sigma regulatory factor (Ser/Thr protein kinase)